MLVSRGLHALLWSTLVIAATLRDLSISRESDIPSSTEHAPRRDAPTYIERRNGTPRQTRPRRRRTFGRLRSRQEEQCSESTFCPDGEGSFQCCGGGGSGCCVAEDRRMSCCEDDCEGEGCSSDRVSISAKEGENGVSTVTLTTTILRTVTAASGSTTTTVSSTFSQTLTFEDPALPTQTNTVTVTAAPQRRRVRQVSAPQTAAPSSLSASDETRTASSEVEAAAGENSASATPEVSANAGDDGVVTITITVELPTTVVGVTTITSTVVNTEFVTVTFAPSASVTKVVTTTVQPGTEPSDDLPGGLAPPTDEDLRPHKPPVPPSGTNSLLPPGAGPNPTQTGTRLPPGVTDILPSGTPAEPDGPQSMQPSPSSTNDPSRPIPGSDLTADDIAGIALGIIFGLLFLILAGFLIHRLVRKRRAVELMQSHQEMSSSRSGSDSGSVPVAAAGATGSASTRNALLRPARADGSDSSAATSPGEGDVRIVIRPAPKRRTQSSGLLPSGEASSRGGSALSSIGGSPGRGGTRSHWPKPPGYSGQTYSFFIEESGTATPLDAGQWSVASEHGSRKGSASTGSEAGGAERGGGTSGGGGSEFLSVGRAFSPRKAV